MPGPLSSQRPAADAHLTSSSGTWGEAHKDAIGVYRGKSQTRNEGQAQAGGRVGVKTPGSSPMGQPPARANLSGKAIFAKRMGKRKRK